jgi:hypothetical protein
MMFSYSTARKLDVAMSNVKVVYLCRCKMSKSPKSIQKSASHVLYHYHTSSRFLLQLYTRLTFIYIVTVIVSARSVIIIRVVVLYDCIWKGDGTMQCSEKDALVHDNVYSCGNF